MVILVLVVTAIISSGKIQRCPWKTWYITYTYVKWWMLLILIQNCPNIMMSLALFHQHVIRSKGIDEILLILHKYYEQYFIFAGLYKIFSGFIRGTDEIALGFFYCLWKRIQQFLHADSPVFKTSLHPAETSETIVSLFRDLKERKIAFPRRKVKHILSMNGFLFFFIFLFWEKCISIQTQEA